jgi:hypothetical protein
MSKEGRNTFLISKWLVYTILLRHILVFIYHLELLSALGMGYRSPWNMYPGSSQRLLSVINIQVRLFCLVFKTLPSLISESRTNGPSSDILRSHTSVKALQGSLFSTWLPLRIVKIKMCKDVILCAVLHENEICVSISGAERRVLIFQNGVLNRVLKSKRGNGRRKETLSERGTS